jgi:hypothetical protein
MDKKLTEMTKEELRCEIELYLDQVPGSYKWDVVDEIFSRIPDDRIEE